MNSFFDLPKLGFGFMRIPKIDDDTVDIEQTKKMVDIYMENGFCYFDTAWGYMGGKSEMALKETLVDRYPRESFLIATKLPAWAGEKTKEFSEQMFYTSLERTGAGYFDFYLLHNLGEQHTKYFDDFDLWNFVQKRKDEGLIKHVGFSFHDSADVLDKLLSDHPEMEFVQLQINYADWEDPIVESRKCYEVACKHGKPVIVMEPVKGGTLATPPEDVAEVFKNANPSASLPSWAIRYTASLDNVFMVLSGMSTIEQVEDNVSYMKDFKPLTAEELAVVEKAKDILAQYPTIPCTACAYCMKECPKQVAIYGTFEAYNVATVLNNIPFGKNKYAWATVGHGWSKASECIKCGKCAKVCPQHINIPEELAKAVEILEK